MCSTAQPWSVQFEARAKWDAWAAKKGNTLGAPLCLSCAGTSKEDARKAYIKLAGELAAKYK